jgi:hypothetical protein
MNINLDTIKECTIHSLAGTTLLTIGVWLGRKIYEVGASKLHTQALQDPLLCMPCFAIMSTLSIVIIKGIASRFFTRECVNNLFIEFATVTTGGIIGFSCCFALLGAASAGQQLPAYIFIGLTVHSLGLVIFGGIQNFIDAWRALNDS